MDTWHVTSDTTIQSFEELFSDMGNVYMNTKLDGVGPIDKK